MSRELIVALVLGFAVFNELLLAVFGGALLVDGRAIAGTRMLWSSTAVGAAAQFAQLLLLLRARTHHWSDLLVGCATIALAVWSGWRAVQLSMSVVGLAWALFGANAVLVLWTSRGWLRRWIVRRRIGTKS